MIDFDNLWNLWDSEKGTFPKDFKGVMLAASGHVDSTALFHLFCQFPNHKKKFLQGLIHVNYCLRGQDSDNDQKLISDLAKKANIEYHSIKVDSEKDMPKTGVSFQDWARSKRYDFFTEFTKKGYVVALAHHQDDLAENVLFRVCRGAEPENLLGMKRFDRGFWRPVLHLTRQDLQSYLNKQGYPYREDQSNQDTLYTRNRIRHNVLPELESIHSGASTKFVRMATDVKSLAEFTKQTLQPHVSAQGHVDLEFAKTLSYTVFKQLVTIMLQRKGSRLANFTSDHLQIFYDELQESESHRRSFNLSPGYLLMVKDQRIQVKEQLKGAEDQLPEKLGRVFCADLRLAPGHFAFYNSPEGGPFRICNESSQELDIQVTIAKLAEKVKIHGCTVRWQIKELVRRNRDLFAKTDIIYILRAGNSVFLFVGNDFVRPDQDGFLIKTNVNVVSIDHLSAADLDRGKNGQVPKQTKPQL